MTRPRAMEATTLLENVLVALHRVCRIGALHRPNNEAVLQTVEQCLGAFAPWTTGSHERLSLLFVDETVYANGSLLRVRAELLETASVLGETLDRIGCNEVIIEHGVQSGDLHRLAARVHDPTDTSTHDTRLRFRRVDPELLATLRRTSTSPRERVQQAYTTALVIMRLVYASALADEPAIPANLRGLVRQLVALADEDEAVLADLVAAAVVHYDNAGQAVKTMVLVLAACRQLGLSTYVQVQAGLAALVFDLGRVRAARGPRRATGEKLVAIPRLSDEQLRRLPAASAIAMMAAGRLNREALERASLAMLAQRVAAQTGQGLGDALTLATIIDLARRFVSLVTYDVFAQHAFTKSEALAELRESATSEDELRCVYLIAHVAGPDVVRETPRREVATAPSPTNDTGRATATQLYVQRREPAQSTSAEATNSRPSEDQSVTTSGVHEPRADSAEDPTVDDDDSLPIMVDDDGTLLLDDDDVDDRAPTDPGRAEKVEETEDEHFSSIVRRYFGDSAVPQTAASIESPRSVEHQVRKSDPTARPYLRQSSADDAATPIPIPRANQNPLTTTLPSTPRVTLENEQNALADGSTARFRINVDPTTGTIQAEDSKLGNESTPGRYNTVPGAPIAVLSLREQLAADFLSQQKTPSGDIRYTTGLQDSGLGSTLRSSPRQTDEYDVRAADLRREQVVEAQSAHLIARAKTPPRPMPAVTSEAQRAHGPAVSEQATVQVSATESARILGGFGRAARTFAPSELRRALAGPGADVATEGKLEAQQSGAPRPAQPSEASTPDVPPPVYENSPRRTLALGDLSGQLANAIAQTPQAAQSFVASEAARLSGGGTRDMSAEVERLSSLYFDATPLPEPTGPVAALTPPAELDPSARATVPLSEATRAARVHALHAAPVPPEHNTVPGRAPLADPSTAPGASGERVLRPSGQHAAAPSATPQSESRKSPLKPSRSTDSAKPAKEPAPSTAEAARAAEQWSITQTLDVGAVQARRFLEAFARTQVKKEHERAPSDSSSLPSVTADPNEQSSPRTSADSRPPAPDNNNISALNNDESSALSARDEDPGAPNIWRRSKKTVKRLRDQRASGSVPVVAGRPRSATGSHGSVEDMLRNYLDDE